MVEERRRSDRYQAPGLKSNISDGNSAFLVVVEDISESGVGLAEVPSGFDETVNKCLAVVNGPHHDFNLQLNPKWVQVSEKGKYKKIGFSIEDPSPEWVEFVESFKEDFSNKREEKSKRSKTLGLMTVVSDGKSTYFGVVEEISKEGLRLTQIPTDFDDKTGECKAVVHSPSGDLNISLMPCWVKSTNRGMYKTVGFQIQNPPEDWEGFINKVEKDSGDLSFFLLKEDGEE